MATTTPTPPDPHLSANAHRETPDPGADGPRRASAPARRPLAAIASWCTTHPKRALGLWLAVMIAVTVGGFSVPTNELSESQAGNGESGQAMAVLERGGLTTSNVEVAAVRAATPAAADAAARRVARAWATVPGTGPVVGLRNGRGEQRSADGRAVLLQTTIAGELSDAEALALRLRDRATRALAGTGASAQQSGEASITADADASIAAGLRTVELVSLPATLIILLVTFGSLVAASVPLLLAILAVAAGLGLGNAVSGLVPVSEATATVVVLLGLATAVDYSLFCVKRFREELAGGAAPQAAAAATTATVGRAVLVAGSTVVIALSAMIIAGSAVFTSMAVGSMLVVTVGVLSALTALPALLTLLGRRIDAGRMPWARRATPRGAEDGVGARLAARVVRRPGVALVAVCALLLALAAPALQMKIASADTTTLPQDLKGLVGLRAIERDFPSGPSPVVIAITGEAARLATPAARATINELGAAAQRAAGGSGQIAAATSRDGATIALTIPAKDQRALDVDEQTAAVRAAVAPLRAELGPGATVRVAGMNAGSADFAAAMRSATPIVVGFVLALAFGLLLRTFGSIRLAAGVIALNLLSICATYGLLVLIFQGTWAQELLGFTSIGAIVDWLPLFAFVVLFGLSMDYTIIVLERIREARLHGEDPGRATVIGLGHTAVAVTSAAAVMIVVFALFGLIDFLDLKMLGIGMSLAVLLDATIVRAIGMPALVALVGEHWQPRGARAAVRARRERAMLETA